MIQFPFTAIVGLEQAKRSLLYHAIDPRIGGALFLGHRGCAKSTLVRAFAEILEAVSGDGARLVEVPLGTGEDRLLGSIDAGALVERGQWRSQAGLIEQANGGVLYIDEVNLLPDPLADLILDSAASGQYRLERDGLTRVVESRYILVGTMNPEEGDLRPQLSDRFGHGVHISDEFSAEQRMQIVERRMQFDDEPERFVSIYAEATGALTRRVAQARMILKQVEISATHRQAVAAKAKELQLEGIRAELAVIRTARCAAAWADRAALAAQDIEEAWHLCLGHRQPEPPGALPNPPAPTRRQPEPGRAPQPQRTPEGPSAAHPDARELSRGRSTPHAELQRWLEQSPLQPAVPIKAARSGASAPGIVGSIAWIDSVISAVRHGWTTGQPGLRLLRRLPARKPAFWCFLDASRSTGMSRFLSSARDALAGLARLSKPARFHLLVLQNGELRWLARHATRSRFTAALLHLTAASGKSLIVEGLRQLDHARLRAPASARDRVIICTDGFATPALGEGVDQTRTRLRSALRRLARPPTPAAWLHPAPRHGLATRLPVVCRGLPIARFAAE